MARRRRWFIPGVSAHIIKRGNNRAPVFSTASDYDRFLSLLAGACARHATALHAYALMTNHIHLIATPETPAGISGFMKEVGERYSRYFNAAYDRIGTPWSGRYKALLLTDERYWLTCLRYIEENPVRAGMVVRPEDYQWTSYRTHAALDPAGWLHPHPVFQALGSSPQERAAAYRRLSAASLTEDEVRRLRRPPPHQAGAPPHDADAGSDPGV